VNLQKPDAMLQLSQLAGQLEPGGAIHALAGQWAGGSFAPNMNLAFPSVSALGALAGLVRHLKCVRRHFDIDPFRPDAGDLLRKRLGALQLNNVCLTAAGVSLPPPGHDRLTAAETLGSSAQSIRDSSGIDVFGKDAATKVAVAVDR